MEVLAKMGGGAMAMNAAAAFKYVLDCFAAALLAVTGVTGAGRAWLSGRCAQCLGFNRRVLADSHPGAYVGPPR